MRPKAKYFILIVLALSAIGTLYLPYSWRKYAIENKEK
jgi:hypothetical protein